MSFPGIIYGEYGDEKRTSAVRIGGNPVGVLMILPDGRKFRQAIAGTAMTAGYLYQSTKVTDLEIENAGTITAAGTIGLISLNVTAAGTAIATNAYADGYVFVASSADAARTYKVVSNNSAAAAATCTVQLEKADGLVATLSGTSLVGLRSSPYRNLTLMVAGTAYLGPLIGVPPVDVPANSYGWVQTSGATPMIVGATTILTDTQVMASSGGVNGSVVRYLAGSISAGTQFIGKPIGATLTVPVAAGFALITLKLE